MEQARADMLKHIQENGGDAGMLLNCLNECKLADRRWEFSMHMEGGTLTRLWWMSPYQQLLAKFFGFVLLLDSSEGKNMFDYHVTTFIVIDGHNKSRNIAYCVHKGRDGETFAWMFGHVKSIISQWQKPESIWSDRDKGIIAARKSVWPSVFHGYCLWHILDNLRSRLGGVLHVGFEAFMVDFWETYRMGSPAAFDVAWARLVNTHAAARNYLQESLYPDRHHWAWASVGTRFVGGTRTTGRVESEHKVFKTKGLNRRLASLDSGN